jgi:DNA polymerase IV (DinB-like DNA polymerase)
MDAFYSSVEERENSSLKGKSVIVGADPKAEKVRGVVMGCSYEARRYGVHSAMPISQAYRLCSQGVYVPPHFELYEAASDEVMKIIAPYGDKFEQVSIDEAFLAISSKAQNFEEARVLANRLKQNIKEKTQLTCSVGVAPNKALAKISSDFKKPDGLTIITQENAVEFLAPLQVSKISGVGKKGSEILHRIGISTIGDLAKTDPLRIIEIFGKNGTRLWQVAHGVDYEEVVTDYSMKSVSSETTFDEDISDKQKIMAAFSSLIEDVHKRIATSNLLFRTVGIKVRFEDFTTFTRARSNSKYTNEKFIIEDSVSFLFHEFESSKKSIRLVGVRVANLKKIDPEQGTILNWADK